MADREVRRSVVPPAASRNLWLAAAWTGAGTALVASVIAIAVVAICWLPAAGATGSADSAIRAGILTFLSGLHGGTAVGGISAAFVPLGLTIMIGLIAWRAGRGLADAANDLAEADTGRLLRAGLLQIAAFSLTCLLLAAFATLGTSQVSPLAAFLAGALLFAVTGAVGFLRASALADAVPSLPRLRPALRVAGAGLAVYAAAGALLVAGSIVVHHGRIEFLSREVGGGWSGAPVLLLGLLAAPNAVIAAMAYLSGPGFAVGGTTTFGLTGGGHGTLPAFPILGALPTGPGNLYAWLLAALTPVLAGIAVARLAARAHGWVARIGRLLLAAASAAVAGFLLAWQGGGSIGSGRLHAVGASPWQLGLALGLAIGVAGAIMLGLTAAAWAARGESGSDSSPGPLRSMLAAVRDGIAEGREADADGDRDLAAEDDDAAVTEDAGSEGKLAG